MVGRFRRSAQVETHEDTFLDADPLADQTASEAAALKHVLELADIARAERLVSFAKGPLVFRELANGPRLLQ